MMTKRTLILAIALSVLAVGVAGARTKLVALPSREATTIRLDNPNATLVQEERLLTLQRGTNRIDFSWRGVQIDPDSIRLKMLDNPDGVNLLSVSYPPEGDSLVWQVYSENAVQERVRISYLLRGLDRLITYRAVATEDESSLNLNSHVVLRNFSGEDFDSAQCVLDYGSSFTTGLDHQETKRVLFFKKSSVPVTKKFTWDAAKKPHDPEKVDGNVGIPVSYVIDNTKSAGLGQNPLWDGKARLFQADGQGSTIFLGEDRASFTPVGGKLKLYIGDSRDLVVTQRRMNSRRVNVRTNDDGEPEVYDRLVQDKVLVENFRDSQATLTVIEHIPGQWEVVDFSHSYEKKNNSTIHFEVDVPADGEVTINMRYRRLNIFASRFQQFNSPGPAGQSSRSGRQLSTTFGGGRGTVGGGGYGATPAGGASK